MRLRLLIVLLCVVTVGGMSSQPLRLSILGDSYSTYEGMVHPDTNAVWYTLPDNPYHHTTTM